MNTIRIEEWNGHQIRFIEKESWRLVGSAGFLRTSVPRIIAKIERGELDWENGKLVKEVNRHAKTPQRV